MELKQKKNLEPIQGNSFAALRFENLNQVAKDANIKIGRNEKENTELINNLMEMDKNQYDHFISANPDVILPVNLDTIPVHGTSDNSLQIMPVITPEFSIKGNENLTWTEVVRRGKDRNKYRSRSDKINANDRCILEYYGLE
jgi:hypothetical protein